MVLSELGRRLNGALSQLNQAPLVDDKAIDGMLKEVCAALLESDVNFRLVANLRTSVRSSVKAAIEGGQDRGKEANRKSVAQKAVFDELVKLVDPGIQPYQPKKGKPNVIMAVGLQGNGKTTTCTKLAVHYQRRGFKSAIVCADTFRAGAFDQTRQSATKAKIAYYGSYTETDPVAIAAEGVAKFKKERFEVIIVDTSGRHRQESELFEEMVQIGSAVEPDMTVLVLDASIGQAAEAQSKAFKESANFGAIIVTKMDGHAKGGGAISAVAATQTPIIFLGTGEHLNDLEKFSPQPFVSKLLGYGDMEGLMEQFQTVAMQNPDRQKEFVKSIEEGKLSIRGWREQISNIMGMGSLSKIASMIPGMPADVLSGESGDAASQSMKRMLFITDSMTREELDSDGLIFLTFDASGKEPIGLNWRIARVARGSGTSVKEVEGMLCQYKAMASMTKSLGGKNGMLTALQKAQAAAGPPKGANGMPTREQMMAARRAMPPDVLQKMRSGGMADMMKGLMGGNASDQDMEAVQKMMSGMSLPGMGGAPGGGGMPDFSKLMQGLGGLGGFGGGQ